MLSVRNISKSYVDHKALDNVSLDIRKGSIFGLLGPNGAGKTSMIRIINQIINQDEGEIFIDEKKITYDDVRKIGYMPEERGLYKKMKVGDFLLFMGKLKGLSRDKCIDSAADWFKNLEVSNWWKKNIEDLSKGMSQKVQFISTVIHNPDLIILDEPFSGFDPVNANLVKKNLLRLKEEGKTIIFSTHRLESVDELCDHLAMINNSKKILDGNTDEIKMNAKSDTYILKHDKKIESNDQLFDVISQNKLSRNVYESELSLKKGKSYRNMFSEISKDIEIISFEQKVPNMNDIFIMKVEEGKNG
ncbi:ATP-binding cassette domain-containing protein [Cytophagia bacterium]|nr:ATP-binding cassette domain-containing protein [Cytophagia bacterium]